MASSTGSAGATGGAGSGGVANRLLVNTVVEKGDEFEERYERAFAYLQSVVGGLGEKEAHDALNNAVCKERGEEVSVGLLMGVLTDPAHAPRHYRDLTLVSRDGLASSLAHLSSLILERYLRFHDVARTQLVWLVRELIRNGVANVDGVCWNLMRYASGGDVTQKNVALAEALLEIYAENRAWLERYPALVCSVVYTYLRLIEDHNAPALLPLRQREVELVVSLVRDRFSDVLSLGRDLVRLLQNVARIPEFDALWRDILLDPKSLCPTFTSVLQLLQTRTSRRFLQSRLTPDMERKLVFLTANVRFGNHKRYQEWFQRQYLATPESQSLRSDMIRFIVGVIHPTNELLCSDIIPRWAVIGWLLTTCTSAVAASNAKLALFYDWLFYDPERDNIMNVEPAILVMHHSMRSHPAVTATLLDFLCRIAPNFHPRLADRVRSGIFNSLRQITEKRVLPSLRPLFDSPKLDAELRAAVRETFKEFCSGGDASDDAGAAGAPDDPAFSDEEEEAATATTATATPTPGPARAEDDTDDDDLPLSKVRKRERRADEDSAAALPPDVRAAADRATADGATREERERAMRATIAVAAAGELSPEAAESLTEWTASVLLEAAPTPLPACPDVSALARAPPWPMTALLPLVVGGDGAPERERKLAQELLREVHLADAFRRVGMYLLFYLKYAYVAEMDKISDPEKKKNVPFRNDLYREHCRSVGAQLDSSLADDLKICQETDVNMLLWLIPDVFREFKEVAQNHIRILHVTVSAVDARQLQDLVCRTLQGNLFMFKQEDIVAVLTASLSWETFEQYCLWQLLTAHNISVDDVLPILPKLEFGGHAEALTSILLMLKQERPTAEVVRRLFCREPVGEADAFVTSALMYWCQDYEEKLADLVSTLLSTRYPGTSPNKRKRPGRYSNVSHSQPTADQVLGHLEQMRVCCFRQNDMSFFNLDSMRKALQQAQSNSGDSVKKEFASLFALASEEELPLSRRGRKGAAPPPPRRVPASNPSSNEDSEEEEVIKPKQAKRRKKALSDSD